jgi:hypothetical protein
VVLHDFPDSGKLDAWVIMHEAMTQSHDLPPGDIGMGFAGMLRDLAGRLSDHLQDVEGGCLEHFVGRELLSCGAGAERARLSSMDEHVEKIRVVTQHRPSPAK